MLTTIIVILAILFCFCVASWTVGIIDNAGETKVMSLHTYIRLSKDCRVFDIDPSTGVGYYREIDNRKDWAIPHWTWYAFFVVSLIGNALRKDVI